jgi:hypothetical protein
VNVVNVLAALTVGLLSLAFVGQTKADRRELERTVTWYFKEYLKRAPRREELRHWMTNLEKRKVSLTDVRVNLLGSKEYFDRHKATSRGFARGLYRDVLDRKASDQEIGGWLTVYDNANGDRENVARQFLKASRKELELRERRLERERRERERRERERKERDR